MPSNTSSNRLSKKPRLRLSTDGTSGPYLIVPSSISRDVLEYFRENDVPCVFDVHGVGDDDVINFGTGADVQHVETVLRSW